MQKDEMNKRAQLKAQATENVIKCDISVHVVIRRNIT